MSFLSWSRTVHWPLHTFSSEMGIVEYNQTYFLALRELTSKIMTVLSLGKKKRVCAHGYSTLGELQVRPGTTVANASLFASSSVHRLTQVRPSKAATCHYASVVTKGNRPGIMNSLKKPIKINDSARCLSSLQDVTHNFFYHVNTTEVPCQGKRGITRRRCIRKGKGIPKGTERAFMILHQ